MSPPQSAWARALFLGATLASLFVIVFVTYAHVTSWSDARSAMTSAHEIHFTSPSALEDEAAIRKTGDLTYDVHDGVLAINGHVAQEKNALELVGHNVRLVESSLTMRFRSTTTASTDVGVGIATASDTPHAIRLVLSRDGAQCVVRLIGDVHALGSPVSGDPVIADARVAACDDRWHVLALRFSPDLQRVVASIDDQIVFTPYIWWYQLTMVQEIAGVTTTRGGQDVGIEISRVTWQPIAIDTSSTDADDTFRGKIIDPFWRVGYPSADLVDGTLATGPNGLTLTARALTAAPNVAAFDLAATRAPLDSFSASVDIDVTKLSHATFHIGIRNEPGPGWRLAEVGFLSTDNLTLVPFESGHFDQNGQGRFRAFPNAIHPIGHATLTFDYDAKTERGHATFDGSPFFDEHIDLPPRSIAYFELGANVDDGGEAALVVKRVRVDHTRN